MKKILLTLGVLVAAAAVTISVARNNPNKDGQQACCTECVCTDKAACAEKKCDKACCEESCEKACCEQKSEKACCGDASAAECPKK